MEGIELFERTFQKQIQKNGEIKVQADLFQDRFGEGDGEWPVEPDRYRILWMPACPHAHKVIIVRKLLGLDKVISLGTTGIMRDIDGWVFTEDPGEEDPVLKIHKLKEIYTRKKPDFDGRPTVPIIVDTKTGQGVNNENFILPVYLETQWKKYHKKGAPDLYPEPLREQIDQLNQFIYERVNQGVYHVGFARSQKVYEEAYQQLFEALDYLNQRLENNRFLFGDYITDSDIRLYPTLARFDAAYFQVFHANRNKLIDFKNLWPYARELYQIPEIKETTFFDIYKRHYQLSPHLRPLIGNVHGILAAGPDCSGWELPTDRNRLSKDPEHLFLTDI